MYTTQNCIIDTQWYSFNFDSEQILSAKQKALKTILNSNYTQCILCKKNKDKKRKLQKWKPNVNISAGLP